MKKAYRVILSFLLMMSLAVTVLAVTAVPDAVLKAKSSVVRVLAEYPEGYATGSGFVIKSNREETLIATNYHVVEGNPYSISIWVGENERVTASVAAHTSQKDMCILRLTYPVEINPVSLSADGAKQGAAVYAVGFPSDADDLSDKEAHTAADATITDGIVSALREVTVSGYGTPVKILQINAAINPGNSGGPLFDEKGAVVGINTYGIADSQGIFGAISVSELMQFAQDSGIVLSSGNGTLLRVLLLVGAVVLCVGLAVFLRKKVKWKLPNLRNKPVVIAIVLVLLAVYPGSYLGAKVCTLLGNGALGEKLLIAPAITRLHDPKFTAYMDGVELLEQRQNREAGEVFAALPGYMDADTLAREADYRYALQRADANDFDTAIHLMASLGKDGYKDAEEKVLQLQYRHGAYLLYEEEDYKAASQTFKSLIRKGYAGAQDMEYETQYLWAADLVEHGRYIEAYQKLEPIQAHYDVEEDLEALTEFMYLEGQRQYYSGKYAEAEKFFRCINPYEDSRNFMLLAMGRNCTGYVEDQLLEEIQNIFDFEDASEVLLSNHGIAKKFLEGIWRGNGFYFSMTTSGEITYNLPWFDYGDYYRIENGDLLLYPKNQEHKTRTLFSMTAITPDCMEFYCHKNNKTYTLNRQ